MIIDGRRELRRLLATIGRRSLISCDKDEICVSMCCLIRSRAGNYVSEYNMSIKVKQLTLDIQRKQTLPLDFFHILEFILYTG